MQRIQFLYAPFLAFSLAILLAACQITPMNETKEFSGTATYRERIALPDGSELEATLIDVSRADAAAEVIGRTRFPAPAGPPIRFSIEYDPERIDPAHRYAVRAKIVHGDRLLFTTDTHYPALTQDAPASAEVLLRRVPSDTDRSQSQARVQYGMYRYRADAGWFTDCQTGERFPVAQEGDNAALERAYLETTSEAGESLLAVVEGRIEARRSMEGEPRPMLIVDRVRRLEPGSCESGSAASLENTYWKVTRIRGEPVTVADRQREPHLILHPADGRVSGNGGCNALTGSYSVESDRIRFSQMAGTMMACPEGMAQEQALHQALVEVEGWRIEGQRLHLLDVRDEVVMELESRYLY
jgi:uncharacterized lipoprotein YbaY/heat shock protein HslJ